MAVIGVEIISPDSEGQRTAAVVVTYCPVKYFAKACSLFEVSELRRF
jgi:hypothetical protein